MNNKSMARFDAKLLASQKLLLEEAARLKGFKNLTEYVISTMVKDAKEAISEYKDALYSVEDKKRIMEVLSEPTVLSTSFLAASSRRQNKLKEKE